MQDEDCKCYELEQEIDRNNPDCDWNYDNCCAEWNDRVNELEDNNIEFEDGSNENYACTCPNCGRIVCGWCV